MHDKFRLDNKVAVVTGGGEGIGRATALALAEAGADVVVAARRLEPLVETAREIEKIGRKSLAVATDVTQSQQVDRLIQSTLDKFGAIDIMVNNAGGLKEWSPLLDVSEEVWDEVLSLNVKSAFLCCKAVARVMIDRNIAGSIINFSSIGGVSNRPGFVHYGAAKAAVCLLTDGLAKEWAPYGIRVNAIAPGYIETPTTSRMYGQIPGLRERRLRMVPLGRLGTADENATVAVFLASDASSYVTGQTILVAGGLDSLVEPRAEA